MTKLATDTVAAVASEALGNIVESKAMEDEKGGRMIAFLFSLIC